MPDAPRYVLGLDLSLTRAAAVLVPLDFRGDYARVLSIVAGHALQSAVDQLARDARCRELSETVEEFVFGVPLAGAFVEDYAFTRAHGAHQLGELRGVLRRTLNARYGWAPTPVNSATVRKLFFGKVPKKPEGARSDWLKAFILASVRETGAPFKTHDEADAFLVANWGLSEVGGVALTVSPESGGTPKAPVLKRPRRRAKAA